MNKSNFFIIYPNFYDIESNTFSIGGVQTYIYNLCVLIQSLGGEPYVIQKAKKNFNVCVSGINIYAYKIPQNKNPKHFLFNKVMSVFNDETDMIIFGSENYSVKTKLERVIAIQHGVFWDLPSNLLPMNRLMNKFIPSIKRLYIIKKVINNFNHCQNRVCVDYNYLNWYRTLKDVTPDEKIWIIPNFTMIDSNYNQEDIFLKHRKSSSIRILFARRFVEMRGVKIMLDVVKRIQDKHKHVEFTFAGEGPLFSEIENLSRSNNVQCIRYNQTQSLEIHKSYHIAMIPSLGSEGTSISVAEAMAAGCTVLASNVGGITNMIIDGYNGILFNPDVEHIVERLDRVIEDDVFRIELAVNGLHTAKNAFSLEKWEKSWIKVFAHFNG